MKAFWPSRKSTQRICTTCSWRIRAGRSSQDNAVRTGASGRSFELVIVRHGRTAWNADGRYQGHTDIPLDEIGREQAVALARALADNEFDVAVSSDLSRARETAEIVLGSRAQILRLDGRLREMRFGAWEGLTRAEIVAREPHADSASEPRYMTPEGGETFDELTKRVALALEALVANVADGSRALVATHAGPLHASLRILLGESEAAALAVKFSPASYTSFVFESGHVRLSELNRTPSQPRAAGTGGGGG